MLSLIWLGWGVWRPFLEAATMIEGGKAIDDSTIDIFMALTNMIKMTSFEGAKNKTELLALSSYRNFVN